MPSRLITGVIVLFWLAMTGWLIHREVVPMMLADVAPTFQPDLTDEIGSPPIAWIIFRNGKRIGSATSKINAFEDRTYEFCSNYRIDDNGLPIKHMKEVYRVTEEGKLKAIAFRITLIKDKTYEIQADIIDGFLKPRFLDDEVELKMLDLGKIEFKQKDNIVTPLHLVNRWRGLHPDQKWKIPRFDLLHGMKDNLPWSLVKQWMTSPALMAEVKTDTLPWNQREVACYKIEYYEPGKDKDITARTWLRQSDGLVLQQEANHFGFEMILQRLPN